MATSEFQTRALYEFAGEGPNELSFSAGELLTITSTTAGHQWWYARNSIGQVGAIPANYLEVINDIPEPPPPPLQEPSGSANTYDYMNSDPIYDNTSYSQLPVQTDYNPYMGQQSQPYTASTPNYSWPSTETVSPPFDQPSLSNEREISRTSSFDLSSSRTTNETTSNSTPFTPSDQYITVVDTLSPFESAPTSLVNPFVTQTTVLDDHELWYSNYAQPSAIAPPTNPPSSSNVLSPFGYSQTTTSQQQQQNSFGGSFVFPPAPQSESIYEMPSSFSTSFGANESNTIQSMPMVPTSPTDNLISLASPTPPKATSENPSVPPASKPKQEKSGFFTLRRQKTKAETEKRRSLVETQSEPATQAAKDENDPDGFTESGSATQNSLSNPNKVVSPGSDAKAPTKARFFDKHGIDNYILHGCKIKVDERVEITYDEKEGGVCWSHNVNNPPFICKVEEPIKGTKLGGLKSFMEYKIHAQIPGGRVVGRRYKQFDWLHEQLVNKFRFICVPSLPGKQIAGRFENEFVEGRRRQLELWLNRICRHPVLCASFPVQHFVTCELTEKNNKDWKAGKRRSEKDEVREAAWLHCVTFTNSNLTDIQIATQIDIFAQQQPGFETHLRNLSQGLTKFLERHTEIYEPDMQRLGELFAKLFMAVQLDTTTPGNKELATSLSKISSSYNGIAELYKMKASEGIRDFNEHIQEYIGLLTCFPMILSIQRSASEFIRSVQQRGPTATPDYNGAIHRSQVLAHVVLSEINFFQKEKVHELNAYLKTLLNEQIQFYENVTSELREAAATLN